MKATRSSNLVGEYRSSWCLVSTSRILTVRTVRTGLTIIEFIVVIAIIGLLIGMLASGVQRARASAARTKCQNNLRQLALALQMYHGTNRQFPPGVTNDNSPDPFPFLSWNARLLPYLDHGSMWSEIKQAYSANVNFLKVPPHQHQSVTLSAFACPSDYRAGAPSSHGPAFTTYLGVEGTDQFSQDGILYLDSRTRIADIIDGTSQTLIIGERPGSSDERLGWWYAGWGQSKDGSAEMVLGAREFAMPYYAGDCPRGPYHFKAGRFSDPCDTFHFWSAHSGGANFAIADGSVRFIAYSADSILPALATRAGREVVSTFD